MLSISHTSHTTTTKKNIFFTEISDPKGATMEALRSRSRTNSESSDLGLGGMCEVGEMRQGTSYDMDGKFTYIQVVKCGLVQQFKTTVDENGKFNYYSSDMRPVPPGWYDLDKSKHRVPIGCIKWTKSRRSNIF